MSTPSIISRAEDDELHNRAATEELHAVQVPFSGGAVGTINITAFKSVDNEDRGGLVFRITLKDEASSFIPYAKSIDGGIELHMAGDIESESLVHALKAALGPL
jgi:hypothetical protein